MRGRVADRGNRRDLLSVSLCQHKRSCAATKQSSAKEEAKLTPSPFEAEAWLKLAKQWRELADLSALNPFHHFSHRTAACLALKSAFSRSRVRKLRFDLCEPHGYAARGAPRVLKV
jgi:hypothetical protein